MPELPEVETVVRGLRRGLIGARLGAVLFASQRIARSNPPGFRSRMRGHRVEQIDRRGKYIIVSLTGDNAMIVHLRMTGRLWIKSASYRRHHHDRFVISLLDDRRLVLSDPRQFARVEWCSHFDPASHPGLKKLGPDALLITAAQLSDACSKSHRPIKSLLLDQTRLSGLGNIYTDESLFAARIHPRTPADSLGTKRITRLNSAITSVLQQAIEMCGTTFDTFSDLEGKAGGYGPLLKVYQRTGLPCIICQSPIRRVSMSGRGTHYCGRCQRA
jgi:formamidopyrimidine-DNA glycosylase